MTAIIEKPGAYLGQLRAEKGITIEYIAGKLHLRLYLIQLLEADDYDRMPEPVFIKGYIRAYAKLLDISPDPLIEQFSELYGGERKSDRALWQNKRHAYQGERLIRWVTIGVGFFVAIAVMVWWNNSKQDSFKDAPKASVSIRETQGFSRE